MVSDCSWCRTSQQVHSESDRYRKHETLQTVSWHFLDHDTNKTRHLTPVTTTILELLVWSLSTMTLFLEDTPRSIKAQSAEYSGIISPSSIIEILVLFLITDDNHPHGYMATIAHMATMSESNYRQNPPPTHSIKDTKGCLQQRHLVVVWNCLL